MYSDKACIVTLLQNVKLLKSKSTVLGHSGLADVVEVWQKLYMSITESLSTRHSLDLSDMFPGMCLV